MLDTSCDEETVRRYNETILAEQGVLSIDKIKTRIFGSKAYVDVEIAVNKDMSVHDAHEIAEKVHKKIENTFPEVKHCMVHVNPQK